MIWIQRSANTLTVKALVSARCGNSVNRIKKTTMNTFISEYYWKNLKENLRDFAQNCIHCIITNTGKRVPRPLSTALHGRRPNEVVHMDFLYIGAAKETDLKYVLVGKDDLTSYCWLHICIHPDSKVVVHAFGHWIVAFESMKWLVSDRGPPFRSTVVQEFTHDLRICRHFSTSYCSFSSWTGERLCKGVLRASIVLLSERRMKLGEWPSIIGYLQEVKHQAPLARFENDGGYKTWKTSMVVFAS